MKFSNLSNIISIRPYEIVSGKIPARTKIKAFFTEKTFPQKVNGWRFGFMNIPKSAKHRAAANFFAEVVTNVTGVKIVKNEIQRMSVPQKRLEMIVTAFHNNGVVEIIGSRPHTANLLFSLLKNKYDVTLKPLRNSEDTLDKLFDSSLIIRKILAQSRIGGQDVYVGLRSGKQLGDRAMSSFLKKKRNLISVGGQLQLSTGRILSYASSRNGTNVLYSSAKNRIGWPEVIEFMDNYIYNGK